VEFIYFGDNGPSATPGYAMVVVGAISRYLALSNAFTVKSH